MNEKHVKFVLRSLSVILLLCTMLSIVPLPAAAAYNYTSIKTGEQLAAAAVTIATEFKTLYVYGCFGAPLTEKNKERYCNNYDYNKQPARTAMIKAASSDTFGFDCVCLIKGILWGWKGDVNATYGGAKYASNGVPDKSANGLFNLCTEKSTDFTDIEIGEMVWMDGHIGVYVGNGLAVECTPAWDNKVQITACNRNVEGYNRRNWTKHGKLPYVEYTDTTYLNSCTAYDSYCEIKVTKDAAPIRDLPCSESTVSTVKVVENAAINTTYKAIGLYMNTANNLWYKVETKNGKLGYIYAGNTSFVKQLTDDCTVSGASSPSKLIKGYAYSIKGTVAAKYQTLTAVGAWVNDSNGRYATGGTETKTAKSYNLSSSKVDAAVKFSELGVGIFTYHIGATLKTHYASDAKTVSTKSQTVTIYNSAFSIVPFEFSRYDKTISGLNTDIDAVVGVSIKKAESSTVNSYAATIYENGVAIGSVSAPSSGWVGEDTPMFWWKASQMGLTLKPGTKYQYTFTINVEGYTLTSQKYDFQTTGSSTYTVTYNANGGTGAPSSQTKKYGVALTLSTTKPTRGGYVFKGWATAQNSSTVAYAPGATFNENKNLSLYAVWEEDIKPATITKQPTSVTVAMGETASTTVTATGEGLTYTWYYTSNKAGVEFFVSSVTSATYTTTMDATRDGRKVYCVITDKYGNTVKTNTVTLSMKSGLAITKQPTNVTVANGEKVATTVTATGEGLTYTWYYTSNGNTNQFFVSSVTSATYSTTMDA
ncbi:MAG: InlB B-repeat-containing protein, partial [Clostridia bacterium]|nr:InlB B-repeat-containing protein [Clostridia bacterium]